MVSTQLNTRFKNTVKLFRKLPGVGPRQAARFILALLEKDESELMELGRAISNLKNEIRLCRECFNLSSAPVSESRPGGWEATVCHICSDPKRDRSKLLVVEKVTDLDSMEKAGIYGGLYHVLGGAINPLDGLTPETLKFKELEKRVANLSLEREVELIIATNPSTTGETTALYIKNIFENRESVAITRLGRGLASGSNLEYADEITLKNALEFRK